MVTMEDVDLGRDRANLIDFIYGKKDGSESVSPSVDTSIPLTEKAETHKTVKPKKPSKKVACSSCSCILLFLFALAAILFAAFLGHYLTKQEYEMANHHSNESMVVCKNFSRPHKKPHRPIINEEDADENDAVKTPTKEQLALPKTVKPVWYEVSLSPKTDGNGTSGVVMMKLNIDEPTKRIELNSNGIEFTKNFEKIQIAKEPMTRQKKETSTTEEGSGMEETTTESVASTLIDSGIHVTGIEINEDLEKVIITLDGELPKGSDIILKVPFVTKSSNNNGLKEYKYKTTNGEQQSMFTTQPNYAYMRHVFPSFDQEAFKAPATMTVMHSKGSVIVANTPVNTVEDGDSLTSTLQKTFDPDFVIGNLVSNEATAESGVVIRVWTRPEVNESSQLALEYAVKSLDALEHILQSRIESKKIDIVAVPGFETGNRVSDSFIVLPEERILYEQKSNDEVQRVRLARIIANRIAAQWFGGITNPEEYGTFWLNDALPKYLEIDALERIENVNSDDLWTWEFEKILAKDATATSRPLRVKNVHSSAEIANLDHDFIGHKGAAVLRMIEKSIGSDYFNKGIRAFVSSYRSAYPYDDGLWKSIEKATGGKIKGWNDEPLDVGRFVNTWVDQIGFPLVSVEKLDNENIEISQERFKNDDETPEKFKFRNAKYWFNWEVPLFMTSTDSNATWLHEAVRLPLNASQSILLNTDSNGFYRVNYGEKRWSHIAEQLVDNHGAFSPRTRCSLLSNAFALAQSGVIPYETALNVTAYLDKETETLPWLVAAENLHELAERVEGLPIQDKFNEFVYKKVEKKFEEITSSFNNEYMESILRKKLFRLLSIINPAKSNEKLETFFNDGFWQNCQNETISSHCSIVPADIRRETYCNGIEFGNDKVFETIATFAENEVDEREKNNLVRSLACFRDPRALRKLFLGNLNSTSKVILLLRSMNSRPVGRVISTNLIIDNWSLLKKRFRDDIDTLNSIVNAGIVVENEREKSTIETFMDHHHKSTASLEVLDEKIESATTDIYWRKRRISEIADYLAGKMKGPAKEENDSSSEEERE